jgi:hypothetical protein
LAEFVSQKEIRLSIAKRLSVVEGKKEIFAKAGAERNATAIAIANTDAFSFAYRNGGSRKRKAWRAERDFVTGSD